MTCETSAQSLLPRRPWMPLTIPWRTRFSGTIAASEGAIALDGTPDTAPYDYNAAANPAQLSGLWKTESTHHGPGFLSIHADGGLFLSSDSGCTAYGSARPRASNKNVFDVQLTYGSLCMDSGSSATGVALAYPIPGSGAQLLLAVVNSGRTSGELVLGGSAPPAPATTPGAPIKPPAPAPPNPPTPFLRRPLR